MPLSAGRRERSVRLYVVLDTDSESNINNNSSNNNDGNRNLSTNQVNIGKETSSSIIQLKNVKDSHSSDVQSKESDVKLGQMLINTSNIEIDVVGNKGAGQKGGKGGKVTLLEVEGKKGEILHERNGSGGIIVYDTTILISPPPSSSSSSSSTSSLSFASSSFLTLAIHRRYDASNYSITLLLLS